MERYLELEIKKNSLLGLYRAKSSEKGDFMKNKFPFLTYK